MVSPNQFAVAVCFSFIPFSGVQTASAEPWPIKDFEVVAVAAAGEYREPTLERLARDVQRLVQETGITDPYFPTLFRTLPVDVTEQTAIENFLGETAAQFEAWGFQPPALEPVIQGRDGNPAFRVFLISNLELEGAAGEYHVSCVSFTRRIILLNRSSIMSGNTISTRGFQTIAHELFHAVQGAYPFFECGGGDARVGDWIVEGQARAVGWDTAARLRPLDTSSNALERWGERDYNQRLQVPLRESLGSTINPYGTSSFWRYLAERHAGRAVGYKPGPEEAPVDYGYLPMLFTGGRVARDCNQLRGPCDAEVDWLNARLLTAFRADLRTVFTNFAEAMALYGQHRSGLTDIYTWQEPVFPALGCHPVPFGDPWSRIIHRDVIPRLEENSIQCFVVTFKEFENDVLIEFKATAPPGGTDVGNLNFAVAGRPMQARRAQVKINNDTLEPSVAWVARVPADETTYLTLTNVADIPSRSSRMTNLPYTVTVIDHYASMSIDAVETDSNDDDDFNYDVTTEQVADMSGVSFGLFFDPPLARGTCFASLQLSSEQHDGLHILGYVTAPLRPQRYLISRDGATENGVDILGAQFMWNSRTDLGGGGYNRFFTRSGYLDITSVSPSAIMGQFAITLEQSDELVDVTGRFSLPPAVPGAGSFFGRFGSDHPCLALPDPDTAPGQPGASGGPASDPDPDDPPTDGPTTDDSAPDNPGDSSPGGVHPDNDSGPVAGDRSTGTRPGEDSSVGDAGNLDSPNLVLDFLEEGAAILRSEAQVVQGSGTPASVALASRSFNLTFALPVGEFVQCAFKQRDQEAYIAIMTMSRAEAGNMVFDVANADLLLDASTGAVRLELEFEKGTMIINGAAPAVVKLVSDGQSTIRGDVTGGSLDAKLDSALDATGKQHSLNCPGLMDFAFLVTRVR